VLARLLVIMEETTREIYYAQLVEEESTRPVLTALREVIEQKGPFCAFHSDRASHFLVTAKTGKSALITDYEVKVLETIKGDRHEGRTLTRQIPWRLCYSKTGWIENVCSLHNSPTVDSGFRAVDATSE
jgi:hypothetical protein